MSSTVPPSPNSPDSPGAADGDALRAALGVVDDWEVDSVAAAVIVPGGVAASHGDPDSVFALASVTKLLTAHAALIAVEEGTLDLGAAAGPPGATVRHLLAHTAGYGFDTEPLMPPERKRIYSNTGFEALGEHLAEQAGMPVADYIAAAVFEPLGMASTVLTGSVAHAARSTVADLGRFAAELLSPRLIHPSTLAEATTVQFPGLDGALPGFGTQSPNDWGLGFEIRDAKSPHWTGTTNDPSTFGHFGAAGTFLWVDPTVPAALVCLTDRAFGPWAIEAWPPLSDAVLAALG